MYLRYQKDGKFVDVYGITSVRLTRGFVECLNDFDSVQVSFPQDCPYQLSDTPFHMTLDQVLLGLIRYVSTFRNQLPRSDYIKLYAALNDLRQDKN